MASGRKFRIVGINFDHMHMGDLLRMAQECPGAEITGICDEQPARMAATIAALGIPPGRVFTDYRSCLETARPDLVILCPATGRHALWTRRVAPFGAHILVEKPFAASLAQADAMIAAVARTGRQLIINWPTRWFPCYITAKRLVDEGRIGRVTEVHYYGGNRGPIRHGPGKVELSPSAAEKAKSWFYSKEAGGGSLLDYLGYGTTLGTWFMDGRVPVDVTAVVDQPRGLEVDEHAIVIARYRSGLSKFETRWGTFTDPWTHQPQPRCGYVLVGTRGTISAYDYDRTIRLQTGACPQGRAVPVDPVKPPFHDPVAYVVDCVRRGKRVDGPLSPRIARIGQQIVDTAIRSSCLGRTVPLIR
jgi:glucose-fructose oxidoreductase